MTQAIMKEIEAIRTHLLSIESALLSKEPSPQARPESDDLYQQANEALKKDTYPMYSFLGDELIITTNRGLGKESEFHLSKKEFLSIVDFIIGQMCSTGIYRPKSTKASQTPAYRIQAVRRLLADAGLLQKKEGSSKYLPVYKALFRDKCARVWDIMRSQSL